MEAGIVGLPNVGKSTLFNALTMSAAAQSANYPFCTIEPNEGMVSVPDGRLDRITAKISTQKVIPAALKLDHDGRSYQPPTPDGVLHRFFCNSCE